MKKKRLQGKRLLALTLAFSMLLSEAAFAVPAETGAEADTAAAFGQAENETVSDNAAGAQEEDEALSGQQEETDQAEEWTEDAEESIEGEADVQIEEGEAQAEDEELLDADMAYNGKPSQVIGVKIYKEYAERTYKNADGNTVASFCLKNPYAEIPVWIKGKAERDPATNFYLYDGKYYDNSSYRTNRDMTILSSLTFVLKEQPKLEANGFYLIDGKYYSSYYSKTVKGSTVYYTRPNDEVIVVAKTDLADSDALNQKYGVDTDKDGTSDYYQVGDRFFAYLYLKKNASGNEIYAYVTSELTTAMGAPELRWNYLSTEHVYEQGGKVIRIGYEIEKDGVLFQSPNTSSGVMLDELKWLCTNSYYDFGSMTSATFRVRGVYYTETVSEKTAENGKKTTMYSYQRIATGEWSEPVSFQTKGINLSRLPQVSGLRAERYDNYKVRFCWNEVNGASDYYVYIASSDQPIEGLTPQNISSAKSLAKEGQTIHTGSSWPSKNYYEHSIDEKYPYIYASVRVSSMNEYEKYFAGNSLDNSPICFYEAKQRTEVPQVTKLEARMTDSKSVMLSFTPVDADIMLYYSEDKNFPQYYTYDVMNLSASSSASGADNFVTAMRKTAGESWYTKVSKRVKSLTISRSDAQTGYYRFNDNFEYGKTYYMVAYTYVRSVYMDNPKTYATINGVEYKTSTALSPASAQISVKYEYYSEPSVRTEVTKDSITFTMSGSGTGYQIYKKSGKKYKLLVTTTDNHYTDKGLKANTKYQYKVRCYTYDKDTKKAHYGQFIAVSMATGASHKLSVAATCASKSSVSLKWTKVAGVKKYEIYRLAGITGNMNEMSKKLFADKDTMGTLSSYNFELVRTITKASVTSYKDKGLNPGNSYAYVVLAYYPSGKKTEIMVGQTSVSMRLSAPTGIMAKVSKNSAKLSWQKDPYAKKYEVRCNFYDKNGSRTKNTATIFSTKKTSITISGIPTGGYVVAYIRAMDNKQTSSWSGSISAYSATYSKVSSGIKAENKTVKLASGKQVNAVKISWKKVKDAAYYVVYRTMKKPFYDADTKRYEGGGSYISKEANDDERNDMVCYDMYQHKQGTITGTSAYDYAQLDSGVKYYYTVVAYDANGNCAAIENMAYYYSGYYSNSSYYRASGKPAEIVYNAKPAISKIKNAKKGQVTLSISKVAGAKKYQIYRSDKKNKGFKLIGTSKKTSYTDKKAKKGKTYYYKVVATGKNALMADFVSDTSAVKSIKVKK